MLSRLRCLFGNHTLPPLDNDQLNRYVDCAGCGERFWNGHYEWWNEAGWVSLYGSSAIHYSLPYETVESGD